MTPMAIAKAKKRMKVLKERDKERQEKLRAQLEDWFEKFDTNGDGVFQRDELRQLLIFLFPNNTAPAEETIDLLIIRATEIETSSLKVRGNKDGAVSRNELLETVLRYRDHIGEQQYLNKFFDEYDTDKSGSFDASELLALLKACAPEGLEVDAGDADYVLELCDANNNGAIDRDELQPLIARWKVIAQERADELSEKSGLKMERNSTLSRFMSEKSQSAGNAEPASPKSTPKVSHEDSQKSNASATPKTGSPPKVKRTLSRQLSMAPGSLVKRASSVLLKLSMVRWRRRASSKRVAAAPPQPVAVG